MQNWIKRNQLLLLAGAGFLSAQPACAQTSAGTPTKEELQPGDVSARPVAPPQPLAIDEAIERSACPLARPEFSEVTFALEQVRFSGLEGVDPALLDGVEADYVGRTVPVAVVCDIRDRAATRLRAAGYLAAVQIPPQEIQAGSVVLDVFLTRIASAQIAGDAGASETLLRRYIDKLLAEPVFNTEQAERYLLLMNDIPGLAVRMALRAPPADTAANRGDLVGVFAVVRTPFHADLSLHNFGSREVGRFGGQARMRIAGLTGLGDETVVSVYSSGDFNEQQVYQIGHEFRLGGEGLTLGGSALFADTRPDVGGGLDVVSKTLIADVHAAYPLLRKQAQNMVATIGLELIDQDTDILGVRTNEDKLRIAYARVDFDAIDRDSIFGRGGYSGYQPQWGVSATLEARRGLGILGASEGCGPLFLGCVGQTVLPSRADGDPQAFVLRGRAKLDVRPAPLLTLTLKPRFQYSSSALSAYEEISGGNYTIGRGYDPGAVIGDSGYGLQAEISYGSLQPKSRDAAAVQPYAFLDALSVSNKDLPGVKDTIHSAGAGIRAVLGDRLNLDLFGAAPLKRGPLQNRSDDFRVMMSLQVRLK